MEVVWVHLNSKESGKLVEAVGDSIGKAFVEMLFGPMIEPGSCKKVKK